MDGWRMVDGRDGMDYFQGFFGDGATVPGWPGWLAGQASGLDKGEITSRPFVGTAGEVREDWRNQRAND